MRNLKNVLIRIANNLLPAVVKGLNFSNTLASPKTAIQQKQLMATHRSMQHAGMPPFPMQDVGFRVHSQYDEDGILLFIFALIGTTNKKCIEICAGDGIECNTANLIINHRWVGMLCDGDSLRRQRAQKFYSAHPDTRIWPPVILGDWISRENVNRIVVEHDFGGEVDLLSLDMDGVDYWLWDAITEVSPRVVVLEFNHLLGADVAVTIPYDPAFVAEFTPHGADYSGASLGAFVKLSKSKGYRLVGVNSISTNAFFVRNDIENAWLPEIDPATCFAHPRAKFGMDVRYQKIKDKVWEEV